jgi:hypothetical protein
VSACGAAVFFALRSSPEVNSSASHRKGRRELPRVFSCGGAHGKPRIRIRGRDHALLLSINASGTTVLMATHNQFLVDAYRQRVLNCTHGTVVRDEKRGRYELDGDFRYVLRDTNRLLFVTGGSSLLTLFHRVAVFFSSQQRTVHAEHPLSRGESGERASRAQAYVKNEAQLQAVADKALKIHGVASVRWVTTAEAMNDSRPSQGTCPGAHHPGGESPSAEPGDRARPGGSGTFRGRELPRHARSG